ncbi:putative splicing factor 3a [Leishmania major strain Friedlin]|uniref:Putative splicing factor 3a n=1 Tax=Leishmania major TaxID=5664 RepID=Q4Q7B2_LEIMA|nr:putative splicing factor 3a [Leishmania major strain Friedlin]CAG9578415.1 splicing_factor_3a_-_putative [Leishmania major strain Friedlin]CAJ06340.1 putative splicing factor 3a [Leishmania major strain Friedlin]|eukprot:XP_001684786.1 putative splicing factor 3a [Leishmania major strain Friedlin]
MQTNVLERIRALEADIERCIDSIVQQDLFAASIENERHRILLDHFTLQQVGIVRSTAEKLLDVYLDEDDIVQVQNAPAESPDNIAAAVKEFEAKIADIREYHHIYRDLPPVKDELAVPSPRLLDDIFTVHERYGACFDMDAHYNRYSAFMVHTKTLAEGCVSASAEVKKELAPLSPSSVLKWSSMWPGRLDFFSFTKALPQLLLHEVEAHRKIVGFALYKPFVAELLAYLEGFYRRIHPLKPAALERLMAEVESDAEKYWASLVEVKAEVTSVAATTAAASTEDEQADVQDVEDERVEEREAGGAAGSSSKGQTAAPVRIAVGNKVACGLAIPPSLRQHVKKFSLWPLPLIEKLIEDVGQASGTSDGAVASTSKLPTSVADVKMVCLMEAKAAALLQSFLYTTLETTNTSLLRDYSRTLEELENDREVAEQEFLDSLEEVRKNSADTMEGTVAHAAEYNLKLALEDSKGSRRGRHGKASAPAPVAAAPAAPELPLEEEEEQLIGENGEPIPRWLAQLHQLDKMFRCDVCGGTIYKGPKVFREHFGAERHAEGLRRLGVMHHLKSYEGITSIRQVVEMREQLTGGESGFRKRLRDNTDNEEIQDARGHVVTAKEYLRLQQRRR